MVNVEPKISIIFIFKVQAFLFLLGHWYSAGVISGRYKCATVPDAPGIFANVTHLKNWVVSAIIWGGEDIT